MRALALVVCLSAACGLQGELPTGHAPRREPPAGAVGGFSIELPEVTLQPGEERWPCFVFPIEVSGPSRMVAGGTLVTGLGMHHGNIMTRKKTGEGVRECDSVRGGEVTDVIGGGTVLFGSTVQLVGTEWASFAPGTAFRLKEGYEIVARMHYINASRAPLVVAPSYEWYTIAESDVRREVAPFLWLYRPFSLPPTSETVIESTCLLPTTMNIVHLLAHTHQQGIRVEASFAGGAFDGQRFLDSAGYAPDTGTSVQFDEPVVVEAGQGFRFACTFHNPSDRTIVEGESADQEMCMIGGYAFPPADSYSAVATDPQGCNPIALYQP
jgi:hypothetical protein